MMVDSVVLVVTVASGLILVAMAMSVRGLFRSSIWDFSETESLSTPFAYALLVVIFAAVMSFIDLRINESPVPISLNVAGILIPSTVSLYLIFSRRVRVVGASLSTLAVAVVAYCLAIVTPEGILMDFPFWTLPVTVAVVSGYAAAKDSNPMNMAATAYVAGSVGVLIGGDLMNLGRFVSVGGSSLTLGAGGMLDFVFLTGIFAVAALWVLYALWSSVVKKFTAGSESIRRG